MEQSGRRMVRYADDCVILCRTDDEALAALREVEAWVSANGLRLHPDKTRVGDSRQPGEGFDFLGYRFEAGRRLGGKKRLKALKDKVRSKTIRSRGDALGRIISDLKPMLRGGFGYFKHGTPALFGVIDWFVLRRLRAIPSTPRPAARRAREVGSGVWKGGSAKMLELLMPESDASPPKIRPLSIVSVIWKLPLGIRNIPVVGLKSVSIVSMSAPVCVSRSPPKKLNRTWSEPIPERTILPSNAMASMITASSASTRPPVSPAMLLT